jgi:hypothetical protein
MSHPSTHLAFLDKFCPFGIACTLQPSLDHSTLRSHHFDMKFATVSSVTRLDITSRPVCMCMGRICPLDTCRSPTGPNPARFSFKVDRLHHLPLKSLLLSYVSSIVPHHLLRLSTCSRRSKVPHTSVSTPNDVSPTRERTSLCADEMFAGTLCYVRAFSEKELVRMATFRNCRAC